MSNNENSETAFVEIDFRDIFDALRRQARLVALAVSVCFLAAILYLNVVDHKYAASMQVISTASHSSGVGGGLANLASMAGVNIPTGGESDEFSLYKESLTSMMLSRELTKNDVLMERVFPGQWDSEKNTWSNRIGFVSSTIRVVKSFLGVRQAWEAPPEVYLQELLKQMVQISESRDSPIVTVVILHEDPIVAMTLLQTLHEIADSDIQKKELRRTADHIGYLTEQLSTAKIIDHRKALAELLVEQEQRSMLASTTLYYSAEIFSNPSATEEPTTPKPVLVMFLATFLGLLFGVLLALVRDQSKKEN